MSLHNSMSCSFQASVILRNTWQQQQLNQGSNKGLHAGRHGDRPLGLGVLIMTTAACFAGEITIAFETIYSILSIQYLGVPVSYVSLNGVVCGCAGTFLVPLFGYLSDKGPNPKKRKLISMTCGWFAIICGLITLMISCFIKVHQVKDALSHLNNDTNISTSTQSSTMEIIYYTESTEHIYDSYQDYAFTNASNTSTTPCSTAFSDGEAEFPMTAVLAIVGACFLDFGCDISVSLTRGYILETVPPSQHMRMLTTSTTMASVAGTLFSLTSMLDIPAALGPVFGVDGIAARLILFCSVLSVIVSAGFMLTILSGIFLTRRTSTVKELNGGHVSYTRIHGGNARNRPKGKITLCCGPNNFQTGDASKPLISSNNLLDNRANYSSVTSRALSSPVTCIETKRNGQDELNYLDSLEGCVSFKKENRNNDTKVEINHENDDSNRSNEKDPFIDQLSHSSLLVSDLFLKLTASSFGTHSSESRQGCKYEDHPKHSYVFKNKRNSTKSRIANRKMIITACTSFLCFGAMLCITMYLSNTLTLEIFKGNPEAVAGTEGKSRYEAGLKAASMGLLIQYISYTFSSNVTNKILLFIGPELLFFLVNVVHGAVLLLLTQVPVVETYYIAMASNGVHRTMTYTVPFLLASKFSLSQDESSAGQSTTRTGQVVSLIGISLPAHYLLVSTFMGPLMAAVGNAWPPVYYSMTIVWLGAFVIAFLFFLKDSR